MKLKIEFMAKWLQEITLEGNLVTLSPLTALHREDIIEAASDGHLWELWYTSVPDKNNAQQYINKALQEFEEDKSLPFAIISKEHNKIIGTTRYMNVMSQHKRVEIGSTWYAKSYQRTGINTECKYLLLQYAFEKLQCIAVEFRTHWHNIPSRTAIARLGAKQDAILRNHQIDKDGLLRDTVVFSIIKEEWPTVKKSLEHKMQRQNNA